MYLMRIYNELAHHACEAANNYATREAIGTLCADGDISADGAFVSMFRETSL